jgi:hypothetical protein
VAWIAHAHGGELRVARHGNHNVVTISLQSGPTAPPPV